MTFKIVGAVILILTHIFAYRLGRTTMFHDLKEVDPHDASGWPHDIAYLAFKYYLKDRNS